jgi:hypothetical protein
MIPQQSDGKGDLESGDDELYAEVASEDNDTEGVLSAAEDYLPQIS